MVMCGSRIPSSASSVCDTRRGGDTWPWESVNHWLPPSMAGMLTEHRTRAGVLTKGVFDELLDGIVVGWVDLRVDCQLPRHHFARVAPLQLVDRDGFSRRLIRILDAF